MEEEDYSIDIKPNVSDIPVALANLDKRQKEELIPSIEEDGSLSEAVLAPGISKLTNNDGNMVADISSPKLQFSVSQSEESKGLPDLEDRFYQDRITLNSINENNKQDLIGTSHEQNEKSPTLLNHEVYEIVDMAAGICNRKINSAIGAEDDNEDECDLKGRKSMITDLEKMSKDERESLDIWSSKLKQKVVVFRKHPYFSANITSENYCFTTKIETVLSDEKLIAQLRRYCDLATANDRQKDQSLLSAHIHKGGVPNGEPLGAYFGRKYCKDENFPTHEASNERQKCSFACWVCLSKFTNCLDVKKHIILSHTQGLCACTEQEKEKEEMQSQLLLFCPNQCNYVTSQLNDYFYHYMVACRNPVEVFKGRNMFEVQKDFISNEYFQLKEQFALRAANKLKAQEFSFEPCKYDGVEETDDQNLTVSFTERNGEECTVQNETVSMKQTPERPETARQRNEITMGTDRNDIYECGSCRLVFSTNLLLESHLKNCIVVKKEVPDDVVNIRDGETDKCIICYECGEDFDDNESLKVHMKEHGKNLSFGHNEYESAKIYDDEQVEAFSHNSLGLKMDTDNEDKPFKCKECGRGFSQKRYLVNHLKMHSGESRYKCDECRMVFTTNRDLKNHNISKHCEGEHFKCTECGKTYKYKTSLVYHMKSHGEQTAFPCTFCGKIFSLKRLLEAHIKTHSDESPFKCDECRLGFPDKYELDRHNKKKHTVKKLFNCTHCSKSFTYKSSLVAHLKSHTHDGEEKTVTLSCNVCEKSFSQKKHLECHMKIHFGENQFKCDKCCMVFSSKNCLQRHNLGKHSGERLFKCTHCSKTYRYKTNLADHLKTHSEETTSTCPICGKNFIREFYLLRHMRIHLGKSPTEDDEMVTNNEPKSVDTSQVVENKFSEVKSESSEMPMKTIEGKTYNCDKCDETFSNSSDLLRHMIIHIHKITSLHCTECDKTFLSQTLLKAHMRTHGERPFECDKCDKRFYSRSHLREHLGTHSGERPFKCHICEESFKSRNVLNNHVRRHGGEKPFLCNECGKTFSQPSLLRVHMKRHSGLKPYQCTICDYKCSENSYLRAHMRTHTGEKPFECKICGVRLKSGSRHMRSHGIVKKRYQCEECGAKFSDRCYLVNHMRSHTGEKPFQCNECGKKYRDNSSLRTHMKKHGGEKSHKCTYCGKGFYDKSHLASHIRVHTGEKPYKCDICGMRFNQNVGRRIHMKKHTAEELGFDSNSKELC